MLAQADRIAFSSYQVTAPAQIAGIQRAQTAINAQIVSAQALDTANYNLFVPSNTLINQYQSEFQYIDGNIRTTIVEQDILDSANKILQNHFFPNDTAVAVPSLSALNNVWPYLNPFALTYGIGKNYTETYGTQMAERTNGSTIGYIPLIQSYTPFVISPPSGTPVATVKATVTNYIALLNLEAAAILAIVDPNSTNTTNNTTAYNNIQTTLIPALNTYLASSGSSSDLTALQTAVTTRNTFLTTRVSQLNTVLGSITQDLVTNGNITASSGLYGARYSYLQLRLNALSGSLTVLASLQVAYNAQTNIIANIESTNSTYFSILPTSAFQANANGTQFISLINVSFLNPGDTVYVMADNQIEMQMAIKTVTGNSITLNGPIPAKYTVSSNARLYKDLS
jgi:hypothetical protein